MGSRLDQINAFLESNQIKEKKIKAISSDASFRKYFRVADKILMDADPTLVDDLDAFINIDNLLISMSLNAPKIYSIDKENGFLLLEDLGDNLFSKVLNANNEESLYKKAIDILIYLHDRNINQFSKNNLVENYSVFKKYPSSLRINIIKTEFLANVKNEGDNFFLGSNGKLIKSNYVNKNLPFVFGKFDKDAFFDLKKIFTTTNFKFNEIKNFFYFKSGRWDIETYSGIKIKLPKDNIKDSLDLSFNILNKLKKEEIVSIDLRQKNQIIIDEK